jgi:hypothetical protein
MDTSRLLFEGDSRISRFPSYDELLNHYTFRYSLCGQLLAVRWGAHGGADGAKIRRLRNDLIDLHFATCATYFDGLMSEDRKSVSIYRQANEILQIMRTY